MVFISIQFKISSFSFIFVMIIAITPPHHKLYWQSFQSISLCLHLHALCPCCFFAVNLLWEKLLQTAMIKERVLNLWGFNDLMQIPNIFTKDFVWGPNLWKFINSVTILFPSTSKDKFVRPNLNSKALLNGQGIDHSKTYWVLIPLHPP